jgi:GDP-4-dehydro-6-deoxy-D-mannose reductase
MAAQTYIDHSWADPATTFRTNLEGTLNLLEIARQIRRRTTIVIACSSAEYGTSADLGKPLQEDSPLLPVSPYGLSKVGQDLIGYQYHRKFGVEIIRARIFNTIGPRKRGDFLADFCLQIAVMERGGGAARLRVGNLDSERDFTDVRDMVAALDGLSQCGTSGEAYNLCSGRATRIRDVLDLLRVRSRVPFKVGVDPALLRPYEEKIILGSNHRLVACTGWAPSIPLSQTVTDTLGYWRTENAMKSVSTPGYVL